MAQAQQAINIQNGVVAFGAFSGNPLVYDVTFPNAFPDANYTVTIQSQTDGRSWLAQNQTTTGFRINSQARALLTGNVYWTAQYVNQ